MLIGILGSAGSGKDTLADLILEEVSSYKRYAFAGPIKRMIEAGFGLHPDIWDDRGAKESQIQGINQSPRYLAQTLGTEWGRELVHPDIWLLLAGQFIDNNPDTVITDVRFDNEANMILRRGGLLLEVLRVDNALAPDNAGHSSEGGISPYYGRFVVENNGTIDDLRAKAQSVLAQYHD